jgi:chemotaxis protein methyltransferase CheR
LRKQKNPNEQIDTRFQWALANRHQPSVKPHSLPSTIQGSQDGPVSLTEHELSEIRMLIEERTSIRFDESRERFFSTRVREHMAAKHYATGTDLLRSVKKTNFEFQELLESLLTQETSFFRYPSVFEAFEKRILPELHIRKFWKNPRGLRIWSAGCSTGEEPYSIAITIADAISFSDAWNVEILATDIGRNALAAAERGVYSGRSIASVNEKQLAAHFQPVTGGQQIRPRLRKLVNFVQMNLTNSVYVGKMDVIFCMNVLIYFSEERRRELVQHFYSMLEPGGYLFLGHSESISKMPVKFQAIVLNDCILYRKPTAEEVQKAELVTEGRA